MSAASQRITLLWHLYGCTSEKSVRVVSVGPCNWAPSEIPQTEPDPWGGADLPYLASLSHEPTEVDHKRYLGLEGEKLDHNETLIWNKDS